MEPEGVHAAQGPILISTNIQLTRCYDFISSSNSSMETYKWKRKEEEKAVYLLLGACLFWTLCHTLRKMGEGVGR